MQSHQLHTRPGVKSHKHRKLNPNVPCALDVVLFLPYGVGSVLDYEWFPIHAESPARRNIRQVLLGIPNAPPHQPTPEEIAAEVDRVMRLAPPERRVWFAEKEKAHLAALANPMPWGGLA